MRTYSEFYKLQSCLVKKEYVAEFKGIKCKKLRHNMNLMTLNKGHKE